MDESHAAKSAYDTTAEESPGTNGSADPLRCYISSLLEVPRVSGTRHAREADEDWLKHRCSVEMALCTHHDTRIALVLVALSLSLCVSGAVLMTNEKHGNERVVTEKPLSEHKHFEEGGLHDPDYDHEAFLGEDADDFASLTPEESKERLGQIFDRIDANGDGFVDEEELNHWIHNVQHRYIDSDLGTQWSHYNIGGQEKLTWEAYLKGAYSFLEDGSTSEMPAEERSQYEAMKARDERRWRRADQGGDMALTKDEFRDFLHPENSEHMKDTVVEETLEDIDTDGDGRISLAEYIHDMYHGEEGEEEPSWVEQEREQFKTFRDTNGDGYLDLSEVRNWIFPDDYDHSLAEAQHLIRESDSSADGKLSREEVLEHYDTFVASQATDFGEILNRHDEF
ncbi:unnamed protein product [Cyprideis torosa]|uniref:Reticulocalbin-3 n=1 Tax=Cyprideis torosa TaxID=163714 RepID=A0A7R8W6W6_9CRUS|nr:unnamed protein product [Cyprideis torosa]CAG0885660.1 unnamed protein product [Cyprideis torosa]